MTEDTPETNPVEANTNAATPSPAELIRQLHNLGLTPTVNDQGQLFIAPRGKITPEIAELIKANKPVLTAAITLMNLASLPDMPAAFRYFAEKQRAIEARRKGQAQCGNCLYFNWKEQDNHPVKQGLCVHSIPTPYTYNSTTSEGYCSEYLSRSDTP